MKTMTPEEQRIAIAQKCGIMEIDSETWIGIQEVQIVEDPDYPNDLNAMHQAEKAILIDPTQKTDYVGKLMEVSKYHDAYFPAIADFITINAEAEWRSEATCRTL